MLIADQVREAASLLERWKESFHPGCQRAEEAENQIFKFNLWTSKNHIFGSPHTSLDWILRNNPVLLSTIKDLLDDLKTSLTVHGFTVDDGQRSIATDFSFMLEAIEDAINQLFRFSRAIHRSGVDHRFVKLNNYVDCTSGMNMMEEFITTARQLLEPLLKRTTMSHEIEDRLIETICLRRQNFANIHARKSQQAPSSLKSSGNPSLESAFPFVSSLPSFSTLTAGFNSNLRLNPPEWGEDDYSVPAPMNQVENLGSCSWFPQPPAVPLDQEEWECPYCMQVCPVKVFSRGKWKEHILGDIIMPYICVLESCPTPNTLFKSMKAWVRHMTNDHISGTWTCMDTRHDTKLVFGTKSDFKVHILRCHSDQFEDLDLDFLADSCYEKMARDTTLTNCPFCPVYSGTNLSSRDLIDHVAQHLFNFARISFEGYFEEFNEQLATFDLTQHNQVASEQGISSNVANGPTPSQHEWNFNSNPTYGLPKHSISGYHDYNRDLMSDRHTRGLRRTTMATSVPLGESLGAFMHAGQQLHDRPDEADDHHDDATDLDNSVSSQSILLSPNMTWDQPFNGRGGYDPPSRGNDYVSSPNDMMTQHEREQKNQEISLWSQTLGAAEIETDDDTASYTANHSLHPSNSINLDNISTIRWIPGYGLILHESSDEGIISEDETDSSTAPHSLPALADEVRSYEFSTAAADSLWKSTASPSETSQIFRWRDAVNDNVYREPRIQPESSYAAMAAFQRRAEEVDNESITATIDSNSVGNVTRKVVPSLNITNVLIGGPSMALSHLMHDGCQGSSIPTHQAPSPFFGSGTDRAQHANVEEGHNSGNSFRHRLSLASEKPSNELVRSPGLTDISSSMRQQILLPTVQNSSPRITQSQSKTPWPTIHGDAHSSNIKLEMDAKPSPGSIAPGVKEWQIDESDKIERAEEKGLVMEFSRALPKPTLEGFEAHVAQFNPRMTTGLIHRFAQVQLLRYHKLVEFQQQHIAAVNQGSCKSGKLCFSSGGQALLLTRRKGETDDHDQPYLPIEGAVSPDQFPPNIPLPPAGNLPAVFECPVCFQVKTIHKPSDWSRHILEDLQPYMCTFLDCTGPWFFKRKASWVRHEGERHRRLRWWTCSYPGCIYTCARRATFIQHVLREHDMLEPIGSVPDSGASKELDRLSKLVEECKHETSSTPVNEPCRFCGDIFPTWGQLTGHLGMHMEQLALPMLGLLQQVRTSAS